MEKILPMRKIILAVSILILVMALGTAWGSGDQVILDADRVEYDQAEGFAVATGNVRMTRGILRVFAPKVEYSAEEQTIEAFSSTEGRVVLLQGAQRLEGDHLELDMISGEGTLSNAKGSFPVENGEIFATGSDMTTMKIQTAIREGLPAGRVWRGGHKDGRVYRWTDVGFSTCSADNPHYQLVSSRLVIIPGYSVTASRPSIYVAGKYLLSYPFDYVVDLTEGRRSQLLPRVLFEGDKGVGISYSAPFMIGEINASWQVFLWSKIDFEAALSMNYRLSENVSLFSDVWYSWDQDKQEKRFRPQWGADYDFNGWTGRLWWSQAESVTVERALGDTFNGTLWRRPEFTLFSPQWSLGDMGNFQLKAIWGEYETISSSGSDTVNIRRQGMGADWSGSIQAGAIRPFWRFGYWLYDYGADYETQGIFDARFGVKWPLGRFSMESTWIKRWVNGGSPMSWDNYSENEAIYQKIVIPFGKSWELAVRGGYDLLESSLEEMYYRLSFENNCCYRIDFSYRDDRAGEDDWAGITFVINAFPGHPLFLGAKEIEEFGE